MFSWLQAPESSSSPSAISPNAKESKKKLGNFSCNYPPHISSQKINSQTVWEIIFFSLSHWERSGTQELSSLLADLKQVTLPVLRHSLPHKSILRISTQKTATESFSSERVGSGCNNNNILRPYKELTMLLIHNALKTTIKSAGATMLLPGHCFKLTHATYLQHLKKTNTTTFFLGSSFSLIHMVQRTHKLLHTTKSFWQRTYETNSRRASPLSVYCTTAVCSVKRGAPVKGREKNGMEFLPDSQSAAVWVFLERKTEGKTTCPFCSARQNCLECKMEQAGKRQQARNPGNTERALEQTWHQASWVVERKGFYQGPH